MGLKKKFISTAKKIAALSKEEKIIPILTPVKEEMIFSGKVALITGGSSGIGLSIAENLISKGCKVIIAGTNESKLEKASQKLGGSTNIRMIVINVTDTDSLPDKVQEAVQLYDDNKIDILINCAGKISHSDFLRMSESEYDEVMNTNAKGTYFMCQAVSRFMIDNKIRGHILNISSASALRPAWSPYHISKWAVRGMTLGLAEQLLPYGIVVNAIAPGPVATPMLGKKEGDSVYHPSNPAGRYAMPNEIAELAAFMVRYMGNLIVGDTYYITGGGGTIDLQN
jgi:3-oxoacyl-[acyl-carrier protein] reductase